MKVKLLCSFFYSLIIFTNSCLSWAGNKQELQQAFHHSQSAISWVEENSNGSFFQKIGSFELKRTSSYNHILNISSDRKLTFCLDKKFSNCQIWDISTHESIHPGYSNLDHSEIMIRGFSPKGHLLGYKKFANHNMSKFDKGSVEIIDILSGKMIRDLEIFAYDAKKFAFSSDEKLLVLVNSCEQISFVHLDHENSNFIKHENKNFIHTKIEKIVLSPNKEKLIVSFGLNEVSVLEVNHNKIEKKLESNPRSNGLSADQFIFSPDSNLLAGINLISKNFLVWDMNSGKIIKDDFIPNAVYSSNLRTKENNVLMSFNEKKELLMFSFDEKNISIWNLNSKKQISSLNTTSESEIISVDFVSLNEESNQDKFIVVQLSNKTLELFKVNF